MSVPGSICSDDSLEQTAADRAAAIEANASRRTAASWLDDELNADEGHNPVAAEPAGRSWEHGGDDASPTEADPAVMAHAADSTGDTTGAGTPPGAALDSTAVPAVARPYHFDVDGDMARDEQQAKKKKSCCRRCCRCLGRAIPYTFSRFPICSLLVWLLGAIYISSLTLYPEVLPVKLAIGFDEFQVDGHPATDRFDMESSLSTSTELSKEIQLRERGIVRPADSRRLLGDGSRARGLAEDPARRHHRATIVMFYYSLSGSNVLTASMLIKINELEQKLRLDAGYRAHCQLTGSGECVLPDSVLNVIFAEQVGNELVLNGKGPRPINIKSTLAHMAQQGLLGFFDREFKASKMESQALGCGHSFGRGTEFADILVPLRDFIAANVKPEDDLQMAFFASELMLDEIELEVFESVKWAIFALLFVMLYMWVHTGSLFLAVFGMVQIILAFPTVYYVYYVHMGIHEMGIINLMSLFVLCGIGTDDVFILTDTFLQKPIRKRDQWGEKVPGHVDRTDRLVWAYHHAGSAMFVTSLTTAASFYSNTISKVSAIRNFGLWMGSLVVANYILVLTLYACALMVWDRYLRNCCRCKKDPADRELTMAEMQRAHAEQATARRAQASAHMYRTPAAEAATGPPLTDADAELEAEPAVAVEVAASTSEPEGAETGTEAFASSTLGVEAGAGAGAGAGQYTVPTVASSGPKPAAVLPPASAPVAPDSYGKHEEDDMDSDEDMFGDVLGVNHAGVHEWRKTKKVLDLQESVRGPSGFLVQTTALSAPPATAATAPEAADSRAALEALAMPDHPEEEKQAVSLAVPQAPGTPGEAVLASGASTAPSAAAPPGHGEATAEADTLPLASVHESRAATASLPRRPAHTSTRRVSLRLALRRASVTSVSEVAECRRKTSRLAFNIIYSLRFFLILGFVALFGLVVLKVMELRPAQEPPQLLDESSNFERMRYLVEDVMRVCNECTFNDGGGGDSGGAIDTKSDDPTRVSCPPSGCEVADPGSPGNEGTGTTPSNELPLNLPSAPQNLKIVSQIPPRFLAQWEPPSYSGGVAITEYQLQLRANDMDSASRLAAAYSVATGVPQSAALTLAFMDWNTIHDGDDATSFSDNLPAGTTVRFRVRARNTYGWGGYTPASSPFTVMVALSAAPVITTSAVSPIGFSLAWVQAGDTSQVTGFVVQAGTNGTYSTVYQTSDRNARSAALSIVVCPRVLYSVRVAASTLTGTGQYSDAVDLLLAASPAPAPTVHGSPCSHFDTAHATIVVRQPFNATATSVSFAWAFTCVLPTGDVLAPSDFEYLLHSSTGGTTTALTTDRLNGTVAAAPPSVGAGAGTLVTASVQYRSPRIDSNAFSAAGAPVSSNTRLVEPSQPPKPKLSVSVLNQLDVSGIVAEYEGLSAVTSVTLRLRPTGSGSWVTATTGLSGRRVYETTLTSLQTNTEYEVQASACNTQACSPYSASSTYTTLPVLGVPPAPTNVAAANATDSTARWVWTAPTIPFTPRFRVELYVSGVHQPSFDATVSTEEHTATGLSAGVAYEARVVTVVTVSLLTVNSVTYDSAIAVTASCTGVPPCSGNGDCTKYDAAAVDPTAAYCACHEGYAGPVCAGSCPSSAAGRCSGHGTCDVAGGSTPVWAFPEPTDPTSEVSTATVAAGDLLCRCGPGYVGAACEAQCRVVSSGPMCSGHGACHPHGCDCSPSFAGAACDQECAGGCGTGSHCVLGPSGPQCECLPGHIRVDEDGSAAASNSALPAFWCTFPSGCLPPSVQNATAMVARNVSLCSGRGSCNPSVSAEGVASASCTCERGFVGATCTSSCGSLLGTECSGHGTCQAWGYGETAVAACDCDSAYGGDACADPLAVEWEQPEGSYFKINVIWGVVGSTPIPQPDGTTKYDPVYDPDFDLRDPTAQIAYAQACDELRAEYGLLHPRYGGFHCPMEKFRNFQWLQGLDFPVPKEEFNERFVAFIKFTDQTSRQFIGLDANETVVWVKLYARTPLEWGGTSSVLEPAFEEWDRYIDGMNARYPKTFNNAFHSSDVWVRMAVETEFVLGTLSACILSVSSAILVTMVFTQSVRVAIFSGLSIAGILGCVAAVFVMTDRSLGAMEAVTLVVLVGLSVDYCLHVAHAYYLAPVNSRKARAQYSLEVMGSSIMSSAVTTGGASAFLLFASVTVLSIVGFVMVIMVVLRVSFTLLLFLPLMASLGPERGSGCCDRCNCFPDCCRRVCCCCCAGPRRRKGAAGR